jgi:tetratricopeptide (TPR) repeat protein
MKHPTEQGIAALDRGDWEAAELSFTRALQANPLDLGSNIGMARLALAADYPEDVLNFTRIPGHGSTQLADLEYSALRRLGRHDEAFLSKEKFLENYPEKRVFRISLGSELLAEGRAAEAQEVFREGSKRDPLDHLMVGGEAATYWELGRMDECRRTVEKRLRLLPDDPIVFSQWIAIHAGDKSTSARDLFELGKEWDQRFGTPTISFQDVTAEARVTAGGEKIRVGFVSSTFRHHANCQFLLPLLGALNRENFMLFAYHDGGRCDEVTGRCKSAVDTFRSIHGMPEKKAAELIRNDRIDILVDINSYFDDARIRIFTYRPAPVQVHYLGGVSTTGLRCMDWRIADNLNEPASQIDEEIGTERVYRIAGGIHSFHPLRPTADVNPLPLNSNGFVTFGCLSALHKIEDHVLKLWASCMEATPGSRLRLVKQIFRHQANRVAFSHRASLHGIDTNRLDLVPGKSSQFDDLSVYHDIDIALDTFPYSGITTTCEALWMGVPVVTFYGNRFVAREGAAILERVGHPEWIIEDEEEGYIDTVRCLASDADTLALIRRGLRKDFQHSTLHDPERLAKELEKFFVTAVSEMR